MIKQLINLSRNQKRTILLIFDALAIVITLLFAFSLRMGEWYWPPENIFWDVFWIIIAAPLIAIPVFIRFGLYRAIIRYISFHALWSIMQAVSLYALLWGSLVMLTGTAVTSVPRSVTLINWIVALLAIGSSRMIMRWWLSGSLFQNGNSFLISQNSDQNAKKVLIYGAGNAGIQLSGALSYSTDRTPVAFVDDDPSLHRQRVNGLKIYSPNNIAALLQKWEFDEILLAVPSASQKRKQEIISNLETYSIRVLTLPSVAEIAQGKVELDDLREINIDDLLGRTAIEPNEELLYANIRDKVVMVTGAGGSIGSELCRQITRLKPTKLILFEQNEFALYQVEREILSIAIESGTEVIPILGNIVHQKRLECICRFFKVQTIYHTAAYKHVPMVEKNTIEGVQNNIFGTWHCANAAINTQVETFVLISTDKAVRPTNTMGATKRFAELILQALSIRNGSDTRFTMVRFGNVLGSSGSVVPLFHEQIRQGLPVTVTDPEIIRYFMTIPEASQLVIQAGAMGQGGDVFVLDMGEPVRILDLAKRMIHLAGLSVKDKNNPAGDIEIVFTGLRPGEKLYEELLIGDTVFPTQHKQIMRAEEEVLPWEKVELLLTEMQTASQKSDQLKIRELLLQGVSGFQPQCEVVDVLQPKC